MVLVGGGGELIVVPVSMLGIIFFNGPVGLFFRPLSPCVR